MPMQRNFVQSGHTEYHTTFLCAVKMQSLFQSKDVVHLGVEHDFRRSVPASRHILCEASGVVVVRVSDPGGNKGEIRTCSASVRLG